MNIKSLESWYEKNHRKLPFRENRNPYSIWVSEIMLQQTQVETVLPFFERFMKKYPDITALAQSNEDELASLVEGLGYYRRFKNMRLAAIVMLEKFQGDFPKSYEDIISLPGIGAYTAGAITSISYNLPYSALDGNVIRVLSRYLGIDDDFRIEKNRKKLNHINQSYIEKANPNVYTQAMMELGALICRPKNPKCDLCPLQENCVAFHDNRVLELPYLTPIKKQKEFYYITLIISTADGIYVRKRTESLLEGLYEYPQFLNENIFNVTDELEEKGIWINVISSPLMYKHVFSHQIWYMQVYEATLLSKPDSSWILIPFTKILETPMAIAHRKIKIK